MNPTYLGDSYDLVKRFFCLELSQLGYSVDVDPMLTGDWSAEQRKAFYLLIGKNTDPQEKSKTALFLDPDTGIKERRSAQHVSFDQIADEAKRYQVVFAFDQSFRRQAQAQVRSEVLRKLAEIRSRDCHGMYYESHARFFFVAKQRDVLEGLRRHFLCLGLPAFRLLMSEEKAPGTIFNVPGSAGS